MSVLNSIFSWIIKKRIHQIELFIKYPHDVQKELLTKLISSAKDTEWGKQYHYHSIQNINAFKDRVPLQTYTQLKPYVERLKSGEQNLLWNQEIRWFAKSSGTTEGVSKFIPVSKASLEDCHYKGGKDMLSLYYHNRPNSKLFSGKSLVVGGSSQINHFSSDSYYGDLSAIIIKNLPFWVEYRRTPEQAIALLDNWEEKLEKMAQITSKEDVTNLSGVPSWTLVLLQKIIEITGKETINEVWPNLELFMHGGVSFLPYDNQYQNIIGKNIDYLETYNASEGFFGIRDELQRDDMLLMLDYGIYYEFIPLDELSSENPKTLALHEVKTDIDYAIVISTNAGLWRYIIGDVVKFTSLSPFRIKVSGRTKQFLNAFGEELIIENVEQALKTACDSTGAIVNEFTVAPKYMSEKTQGAHEWIIEFNRLPNNLNEFNVNLDNALKAINSDYKAKRQHNLALNNPIIINVPKNTFYNWMKVKGKLGGQHKVPRLSNSTEYIDSLKEYLTESNTVKF